MFACVPSINTHPDFPSASDLQSCITHMTMQDNKSTWFSNLLIKKRVLYTKLDIFSVFLIL